MLNNIILLSLLCSLKFVKRDIHEEINVSPHYFVTGMRDGPLPVGAPLVKKCCDRSVLSYHQFLTCIFNQTKCFS